MSSSDVAVVTAKLENLDRKLDAVHHSLKEDISEVKEETAEIKREAKHTNGRLRKVEEWRAMTDGALAAFSLAKPIVYTALGTALGVIVKTIFGS